MENASKALIMAGSILISIIIISLGIMVFKNMSNSVNKEASLTKQQIVAFNSKISPYLGESVSGSQVNALMQLVRTMNAKADNEGDTTKKITVNGNETVTRYDIGKFYKVEGQYNTNGLLTILEVSDN